MLALFVECQLLVFCQAEEKKRKVGEKVVQKDSCGFPKAFLTGELALSLESL